ncbi:MAG: metal-dependent phosphohydrolase sub domain protein, partial [Actinomycetia bacterium]|nr:metal-dependent phosphohydrolase sub domain protein [Actinomycetes bacterium]
ASMALRRDPADLEAALALAEKLHRSLYDKAGNPYIDHITRVVARVDHDADKIAAALHDVVEDMPSTLDNLAAAGFAPDVVDAIDAVSRRPGETCEVFLSRVAVNEIATRVKFADLADNSDEQRLARLPTELAARHRDKYARALRQHRAMTN